MVSGEAIRHYVKKKTFFYKEANQEDREAFRRKVSQIDPSTLIYIDESGVDDRLYRTHGKTPRGIKIYAGISGKRIQQISIIEGLMNKKFLAPMTFQGGCDSQVFNTWLKKSLIPQIPPGTTLVMDNASFHKSAETKRLIEEANSKLLFLPTYSPDLNPIEHG